MNDLPRLFAYDAWANRETLTAVRCVAKPPPRVVEILAHIAAAEDLWHARITMLKKRVEVWPKLTVDECEAYFDRREAIWPDLLEHSTPADLSRAVEYTNSMGEHWSNTVGDILHHVNLHGAYHRGQIATHMRNAGLEPAYTDFIHALRQKKIGV